MNYSFVIRRATVEDAVAVSSILHEAFKKYMSDSGLTGTIDALQESVDTIREEIACKYVFVAFVDDTPVGTIRVQIMPDNTAYISRFGVGLQYHNIGIGKSLIHIVDKLLVSKNVKKVSLHTTATHRDLVRFYYARGFYIDSTSKDRGYIRALMVKEY